jgi:hypothetical protein
MRGYCKYKCNRRFGTRSSPKCRCGCGKKLLLFQVSGPDDAGGSFVQEEDYNWSIW